MRTDKENQSQKVSAETDPEKNTIKAFLSTLWVVQKDQQAPGPQSSCSSRANISPP